MRGMKNFFNRKFVALFCAVLFSILFIISTPSSAYAETNDAIPTINTFIETYNLENYSYSIKNISDFSNNTFKLYEFSDKAYAICSNDLKFIEGSATARSPYYGYESNLYYLGPTYYFTVADNKLLHTVLQEKSEIPHYESYDFNAIVKQYSDTKLDNFYSAKTRSSNQMDHLITYHKYFENYIHTETSTTCGITALSILLGYYDTYINDNFIPDNSYIDGDLYQIVSLSNFAKWIPSSISVNYSFQKLLFDKYMVYNESISNIEGVGGYPMADVELKKTMKNYLAAETNIPSSQITHYSGALFFTHANPRKLLDENIPVILIL